MKINFVSFCLLSNFDMQHFLLSYFKVACSETFFPQQEMLLFFITSFLALTSIKTVTGQLYQFFVTSGLKLSYMCLKTKTNTYMKNREKFGFDLKGLRLTEACKFSFEIEGDGAASFIKMCEDPDANVYASFGTKEHPNILTAYEYVFKGTEIAGHKLYVILNQYKDKKNLVCFSLVEQDIIEIMQRFISQYVSSFNKAA
jgi:hypothetical protein